MGFESAPYANAMEVREGWQVLPLSDCIERIIDYRGWTPPKSPSGIPCLTAANVKDGRVHLDGVSYVSEETYREITTRGFPQMGDVLLTTEAPVAEVAPFPGDRTYHITRRVIAIRADEKRLLGDYLLYALQGGPTRELLRSRIRGSTVERILKEDITRLPIPLPPIAEQRRIAHILGALDDKIELNRRMNETLEAMARALFKSWFVDFHPVRAKAEGRQPSGMDAETAKLFPSEFEESELGLVPRGWRVAPLDEIAAFRNGLALQKFRPTEGTPRLPAVKIAQLRTGHADSGEWASADIVPDCIIDNGDVVFSWSGSLTVVIWCGGRAALNQHLFRVTSIDHPKWFYLHWLLVHLPEFQRIAGDKATTMGHIQRHHLTAAKCAVPPADLLHATDRVLAPLITRRVSLELESRSLAHIRDTLLPGLLSGEIDTSTGESLLEASA